MPRADRCTGSLWSKLHPTGNGHGRPTKGCQQGGALAPPHARHPRASRGVAPSLQSRCFPTSQPRAADPSGRIPNPGSCSGRSPPGAAAPTAPDRTGAEANRRGCETFPPAAEAGSPADARVAGPNLRSRGPRWRLLLAEYAVPFAVRDRAKDHRHGVVGADLLRAETRPIGKPPVIASASPGLRDDGGQRCRGVTRAASAAPSTPANLPRKGSNRSSTRSRRSAKPARPTSAASVTRAGYWPGPATTTAGSRVATWSGPLCNACSPTSREVGSTSSSSTRPTG